MGNVLDRPVYAPLWAAARRRVEANGLSLVGTPLSLRDLSAGQADAIAGLLGAHRPPPGVPLRVKLVALDAALRSSAVGQGLLDVLADLGGPLVDRRAGKVLGAEERAARWATLDCHPAVMGQPRLIEWLVAVRVSGLARRLAGADEATAVQTALDVLAVVGRGDGRHRLAELAACVTGDSHGLDRGRPAGTLAVHALSRLADRPHPADAADWRRTWAEAGVACDDLSCDVLVLNLPGWPAEPLRLTLRQVRCWTSPSSSGQWISVCENPAVVAAAADHLEDRSPPVVCLDGMPSTAALIVLDGLVMAGHRVRYHGDFDWRGLTIAEVLFRKVPGGSPWRYDAADYQRARNRGLGTVALAGRVSTSSWDPQLARVMAASAVAVYEEQVVDELVEDLVLGRPGL